MDSKLELSRHLSVMELLFGSLSNWSKNADWTAIAVSMTSGRRRMFLMMSDIVASTGDTGKPAVETNAHLQTMN